jgi:hypothetical protein
MAQVVEQGPGFNSQLRTKENEKERVMPAFTPKQSDIST